MIPMWVKIESLVFNTVCNIQFEFGGAPEHLTEWIWLLLCEVNYILSILHQKCMWVRQFCILCILLFQCMPSQILSHVLHIWQPVFNERQMPRFFVMARTRWQQLSTVSLRHESHMWSKVALTSSLPLWLSSAASGRQIAGGGHSRPTAKPGVSLHTHCECGQPWSVRIQFDNGFFPCTWIFCSRIHD